MKLNFQSLESETIDTKVKFVKGIGILNSVISFNNFKPFKKFWHQLQ